MFKYSYEKLSLDFFLRPNVVEIARDLVGKYLVTGTGATSAVGKIIETEAYDGRVDKACHAYHKVTPRTEVMYRVGGIAYVYLCYGIHKLFNIVTNTEGMADAVLIRALEPIEGIDEMKRRRGQLKNPKRLTAGPGALTCAMGIGMEHNKQSVIGEQLFIASAKEEPLDIVADRRVGVDYAEEDAALPWRFFEKGNPYISRPKQKPISDGINH